MINNINYSLLFSCCCLFTAPFFVPNATNAEESKIEISSLCGTWQAIPGSGDYVYGPEDFPVKKLGSGVAGTIIYDVHTHGMRTLRANQAVSLVTPLNVDGSRLIGGKTRSIYDVQKFHGAVQGDSIYLANDMTSGFQKWIKLPGNKFDVIVLRSGKYPSASQYTIEKTASRTCK